MSLSLDACRYFLSLRLGRWEFFAERKASPFYRTHLGQSSFSLNVARTLSGAFLSFTVEVPLLALNVIKHPV